MKSLKDQCLEICKFSNADSFGGSRADACDVARNLATHLLNADAVNMQWNFEKPYTGIEGIVSFLQYMDDDLIGQLLAKGLDLNQEQHNGVLPFTWFIGNAENDLVDKLLTSAEQNQTIDQRLVWISKKDEIERVETIEDKAVDSCSLIFSTSKISRTSKVGQTPLQLTVAKGYTDKSGSNHTLKVGNLQLTEKLLSLGADKEVNYQEPTKGNTALHIAYIRRDFDAIQLLEKHGASQSIRNNDGETPADMLSLSFNQVKKLLEFHTSPDGHPNTFRLNEAEFNDPVNLKNIQKGVKNDRQIMNVEGKNRSFPSNPLIFNEIESRAIEGYYDVVSSLVHDGCDPSRAMKSIQHRINLIDFMTEDSLLILEKMPWPDYVAKRQELDDKYHGSSNPYMYNMDYAGYEAFQRYLSEHKEEGITEVKELVSGYAPIITQLNQGVKLLEEMALQKAAMQDDKIMVEQLLGEGIETQRATKALESMVAAFEFKQTLKTLSLALFKQEITWDICCQKIDIAYELAGGASNYYLPDRKYQHDKAFYEEAKFESFDRITTLIEADTVELDDKLLKCKGALSLISKQYFCPHSVQNKFKENLARISDLAVTQATLEEKYSERTRKYDSTQNFFENIDWNLCFKILSGIAAVTGGAMLVVGLLLPVPGLAIEGACLLVAGVAGYAASQQDPEGEAEERSFGA